MIILTKRIWIASICSAVYAYASVANDDTMRNFLNASISFPLLHFNKPKYWTHGISCECDTLKTQHKSRPMAKLYDQKKHNNRKRDVCIEHLWCGEENINKSQSPTSARVCIALAVVSVRFAVSMRALASSRHFEDFSSTVWLWLHVRCIKIFRRSRNNHNNKIAHATSQLLLLLLNAAVLIHLYTRPHTQTHTIGMFQ